MRYNSPGNTTKQRILDSAAELFSEKGFTETPIRELARAAGLKNPASLYHHFPSKNAILEYMLEEYWKYNTDVFKDKNITQILTDNPNSDGVLACLQTSFPTDRAEFFLKVLCVLLQEQLRDPLARSYMCERLILRSERNTRRIIEELKEIGAIRQDTDPDYWAKVASSLFYAFASRAMLGIGDSSPGFTGMKMADLLRNTYDLMFEKCGTAKG